MTKNYLFMVIDCENSEKPIIFCKKTTDKAINDQETAENLILDYAEEHFDGTGIEDAEIDSYFEEMAYTMRKNGAVWLRDRYCFELTEVNS